MTKININKIKYSGNQEKNSIWFKKAKKPQFQI
jgi:hypothetical protein